MSEWTKLSDPRFHDRKWELKHNGVVLGTIFHKPEAFGVPSKFSLYVSSPKVYARFAENSTTHQFDTFDEAVEAFEKLGREQVLPWVEASWDYFKGKTSSESEDVV